MVKSDSEYMVEHLKQMCLSHVKANKKLRDENIQIQKIMNKFMQKSARLEDELDMANEEIENILSDLKEAKAINYIDRKNKSIDSAIKCIEIYMDKKNG